MQTTYHVAKETDQGMFFLAEGENAFCADTWSGDLATATAYPMDLAQNIVAAMGSKDHLVIERADFDGQEAVRAL